MLTNALETFIKGIPKAELHLHIEGTFEPELMFKIAQRNQLTLPYESVEALKEAYKFNNLQEFLDIYYAGASVLLTEQDFYDLTYAYLIKAHQQNITHVEIFFDPQTHTERGIAFKTVITGIYKALQDGKNNYGISFKLICSFLRHLDEKSAFKTFEEARPFIGWIDAFGLDSSEMDNPPSKFENVFKKVKETGFKSVAHAGEEGPAGYIWEAIHLLKVDRIDHGNSCMEDPELIDELVKNKIALTLCPLSNVALKVVEDLSLHTVREMLQKGILATINSDDPAYFGGYLNENYIETTQALHLTKLEIIQLAKNSFEASFLTDIQKEQMYKRIDKYVVSY